MICKCAEADALRSSFPTMLGGLYMKEELIDIDVVKPGPSRPQFDGPQTGTGMEPTPRAKGKKPTVEVVDTTQKTDAQEEADAGLAPVEESKETNAPTTPGKILPDLDHPYKSLAEFCERGNVPEIQLTNWARGAKNDHDIILAGKAVTKFMDMREDSAKYILVNWADLLPLIKQAKAD